MATASETVSQWSRRSVLVGATFLLAWQGATLVGFPHRVGVVLGLYGFALHVLFGKAYALVPTYFDRSLAFPRAPAVQLPLTTVGVVGMAVAASGLVPTAGRTVAGAGGATVWAAGVAVFLGTQAWTIRDNLTGAETATGEANADRRPVDRAANAVVPVALAYLLAGTYGTLAAWTALPPLIDGYLPRTSHLLAAGAVALVLFGVGFRLLPRFLTARPPRWLVAVVLPTGAVGPAVLAATLPAGGWFVAGAVLEATAVVGFALAYLALFVRSDRRRVGFYGVLAGAACGVLGVALGLWFALRGLVPSLLHAHFRLNVLGFLGLTTVGVTYQFYPPAVGTFPGASDRGALAVLGLLLGGLGLQVAGLVAGVAGVETLGAVVSTAGALAYVALLAGLFRERYG
ncbi:MAG: hypothetical protein ABEI96_03190 [Haloarculaceae archaeon]